MTDAVLPRPTRIGLFAIGDFRRLWFVGFVVFSVRWLEMLAIAVFTYQHTGSAFLVAMMAMLRLLPMGLFGAYLGAAAERIERRTALAVTVVTMLSTSLSLAILANLGMLAVWHLAVASFVNGLCWATDNPVRRMMIGEVAGPEGMGAAMSIDVGTNNASRMLGPTVGGLLLATYGINGAFILSIALYVCALFAALRVTYRNTPVSGNPGAVLTRMIEGLGLVRRDRRLIGTLTITIIYNVFAWPFTSMIPVIGQDNLHLGPQGLGILTSMDGVGAFCGAVLMAIYVKPAIYVRCYVGGIALYMMMLILFALCPNSTLAGTALFLTGLASAGFSIMQATLVFLAAPPEMRSRAFGVLSVCIGMGPIGFIALGLLADLVGAQMATVTTGIVGLLVLAATRPLWRAIDSEPVQGQPALGQRDGRQRSR